MPTIIPVPAFRDNYVWAIRSGDRVAVVDPGDAAPVEAFLGRERVALVAIVVTHHHPDHTGGIDALVDAHAVPVIGPAKEAIPRRTHAVRDGDAIVLPGLGLPLEVIDIPGHTAGHVAYASAAAAWGHPVLFCGDTLFAAGCGRLFEGTPAQMHASLSRLAGLPADTRVYCGHEYTLANLRFAAAVEPANAAIKDRTARMAALREAGLPTLPSTLADEAATNPFLRSREPAVRAAAAAREGRELDDPVAVFATIRAWKNVF
jgi:hydroxyacylglutathione hydrolase